jgi:hypothetical protein
MVSVKPDELKMNPVPPQVAIEEFRVDGERLALDGGRLAVPPGRKQFEFSYTGLSFIVPDKVRFRYRLEGLGADWVEAGICGRATTSSASGPATTTGSGTKKAARSHSACCRIFMRRGGS